MVHPHKRDCYPNKQTETRKASVGKDMEEMIPDDLLWAWEMV